MLSLSPRFDLFRFALPKEFLPYEIEDKYQTLLNRTPGVLSTPIDYLNESIQGISFPGISEINIQQSQHSTNSIGTIAHGQVVRPTKFKQMNVEPKTDITYLSSANPLDKIEKQFKVTFRLNQGLYNYFMLYETIFYKFCKPLDYGHCPVLYIELLDEEGVIRSRIKFIDVHIDGIDGLDFNYTKMSRESSTFDVNFKFNNIDFEFTKVEKIDQSIDREYGTYKHTLESTTRYENQ